jgi:hypothetical protein
VSRLHRIAAHLIPPPGREWIEAHESELQAIAQRSNRIRWIAGAVPVVARAFLFQLLRRPGSFVGGPLARRAAAVTGTALIGFGLLLAVLAALTPDGRILPAALAVSTLAAAAATPVTMGSSRWRRPLRAAYFVVGAAAFVAMVAGTVRTFTDIDPEYGPPAVATVLLLHALAVLVGSGTQRPDQDPDPT